MAALGVVSLFMLVLLVHYGEAIMCHRCMSSMGGCGDDVVWRMYPWRDCGSHFCVKVIENIPGEEPRYIRECEQNLMKSTRHRLRMPVLRRHGYCVPARRNDPFNPLDSTDNRFVYCFCNDWNGCNSSSSMQMSWMLVLGVGSLGALLLSRLL